MGRWAVRHLCDSHHTGAEHKCAVTEKAKHTTPGRLVTPHRATNLVGQHSEEQDCLGIFAVPLFRFETRRNRRLHKNFGFQLTISELNNVGILAPSCRDLSLLLRRDKLWGVRLKFMYGSLVPLPQSFIVVDIFQRQDLPWNMASRISGHQLFEVWQIQV